MTGVEVAVGVLVTWLVGKARRAAGRADAVVDQAVDAGVDKVGHLILDKLGAEPAVRQLETEAAERGEVTERTSTRVTLALAEAVEQDPEFAARLAAAVAAVPTRDGGAVSGADGVAVSGGVHSTGPGTAIGGIGHIDTFTIGAPPNTAPPNPANPPDPSRPDRA